MHKAFITYDWVMFHTNDEWVMPHMNQPCHIWISSLSVTWLIQSCLMWKSHLYMIHVTYEGVMHTWISHVTYKWVMSLPHMNHQSEPMVQLILWFMSLPRANNSQTFQIRVHEPTMNESCHYHVWTSSQTQWYNSLRADRPSDPQEAQQTFENMDFREDWQGEKGYVTQLM